MRYYKKDIALEQIKTSIILFFEWKNNISVKTLIHATKVMLEDIDRNRWTNLRMESFLNPEITKKQKSDFFDKLNEFPNFCKHSNKEKTKNEYIDTNLKLIESNEIEIYYCIEMYSQLYQDKKQILILFYMSYLLATWKFNYLFINLEIHQAEKFKEIKENHKSLWLTKDNKNLKKDFYNLIIELWILND